MRAAIILLLLASPAAAQNAVSFYFGAHPDDWQLFMNPNAFYDVQNDSARVVFVYLTAGDAGAGLGNGDRSQPYYLARENGAKNSAKFLADADHAPAIPFDGVASVAGHPVKRWTYRNTVSYFFRLPDGNPDGTGYETTGMQALRRLHLGEIPGMTALDGSTTYTGWNDLVSTFRALIDRERGGAGNVWVNFPDTDTTKNVGDHEDHQNMAQGVLEAVADIPCINKALYLDYVTADLPDNLSAGDREIEIGTFGALAAGLTALDHWSPFDDLHRSWLGRHYRREQRGTGSCSAQ